MKQAKQILMAIAITLCGGSTTIARQQIKSPLQTPPISQNKALSFTENKGQVTDQNFNSRTDIDFKFSAGKGLNVFIGKGKIHYQWMQPIKADNEQTELLTQEDEVPEDAYALYRMDVHLIGANPYAKIITEGKQTGYERYFQPWVNTNNSNDGVKAHSYTKIIYKDIYPHIDWVFYFTVQGQLEYDFVLHPGAKLSDIQIQYKGADKLQLNADGSLTAVTPMGTIKENAPYAYTLSKSKEQQKVASAFQLKDNVLSFTTGAYTSTLIIDPVLEWGTYFGGTANDAALGITTDKWGYVYLCGQTNSTANIATVGAHADTFRGGANDAFLSKWNEDGALLWSTYYGGTNVDIARGVVCDSTGNVFMGGNTSSAAGIATNGAFQSTIGAGNDVFIVKFDSSGTRQWATYFGGAGNDANTSLGIAIDRASNLLLTANTQSNNLPTTTGAHQTNIGGNHDALIANFNPSGNLNWCTYYGGTAADYPYGIATDDSNFIYLSGYTQSTSGIATTGTHQSVIGGGQDAFIAKFTNTGERVWGTYFGGTDLDRAYVVHSKDSLLYVAGITQSTSAIATVGSHQGTFAGGNGGDGFLAQFQNNGILNWATYYGGNQAETIEGLFVNNQHEVYISGSTGSDSAIATQDGINPALSGSNDLFMAKLNLSGALIWGSYFGGLGSEAFGLISGSLNAGMFIAGRTNSASGIAINNANQSTFNGGDDAFLMLINDCVVPDLPNAITGTVQVCSGAEHVYSVVQDTLASSYQWILPSSWQGQSDSNNVHVNFGTQSDTLKVVAYSACGGVSDTLYLYIEVLPVPEPTIVANGFVLSATQVYSNYQWLLNGNAIAAATNPTHLATQDGAYSLQVQASNGCSGTSDTLIVTGTLHIQKNDHAELLQIFPNPAQNVLHINARQALTIQWLSITGEAIGNAQVLKAGTHSLLLHQFAQGMYILKVQSQGAVEYLKVIKE